MTSNALLSYLGVALLLAGLICFAIAFGRIRKGRIPNAVGRIEALERAKALLTAQAADTLCGTLLSALALAAEVVSVAGGGPESGESTGNTAGGILAITIATLFCVIVCLVVRHLTLLYPCRKLGA